MENNNLRGMFQMVVRRFGFLNDQCCESCCGQEVSTMQSHILYEISRQMNPSIQDVANALGLDITTFSRQVKALVEKGLVKKTPNPSDNRVYILSLTEKGTTVEESINNEMNTYLNKILSHLSDYEKESVIRSIKLLDDAMRKSDDYCCSPK